MTKDILARDTVKITRVTPLPGEEALETRTGRWIYCSVEYTDEVLPGGLLRGRTQRYLCLDCDAITDAEGRCILCGSPSPATVS